jgi:hypothetical protein
LSQLVVEHIPQNILIILQIDENDLIGSMRKDFRASENHSRSSHSQYYPPFPA